MGYLSIYDIRLKRVNIGFIRAAFALASPPLSLFSEKPVPVESSWSPIQLTPINPTASSCDRHIGNHLGLDLAATTFFPNGLPFKIESIAYRTVLVAETPSITASLFFLSFPSSRVPDLIHRHHRILGMIIHNQGHRIIGQDSGNGRRFSRIPEIISLQPGSAPG